MYDIAIIGSGWAGITAAIHAAKNNLSVCLIEKESLGGTCLNSGCIPTKVFVTSACHLFDARHSPDFGVNTGEISLDYEKAYARKEAVVSRLKQGLEGLVKAKKIELRKAGAKITGDGRIEADGDFIAAKTIIIASGSRPRELPNLKFDASHILSSTDMLNLKSVPGNLLIIGGGVIGCEFAAIFSEFGAKVTIVEIAERILITEDREISRKMQVAFKKRQVDVLAGTNFTTLNLAEFDKVLLCVGRAPNIEGLGLEVAGIKCEKGRVCVDENLKTNLENIYAVGDCNGGYQLAHVAAYEGRIAVDNILGKKKKADFSAVPNCIFTRPEISSVGIGEDAVKEKGLDVKILKFNFMGLGMAHVKGEPEGFMKIIADNKSGQILGASIMGIGATEMISALAVAVRNRLKVSDIHETIFPHPTLSESIHETVNGF
ncbi:MAG: dihydrolipoyl dehydrogenase [Candidatus Omnitrophica bacterium CG11_big_fil_rev_8_21_14_0_20_42_13]|uniref:Dihydrolipoyl dehydrogenase n=1 Tax=Candidatus Ghiorseimicrobium undicola TaxID=1974746 RepID=A0A2H0LYT6_9BACT|nr:MAG: dihydrolipoyl dehydrogenase [Candidatus Omnitrophica bacterium CG11_big_fil_rev_8_21_14_0_20_42_13]